MLIRFLFPALLVLVPCSSLHSADARLATQPDAPISGQQFAVGFAADLLAAAFGQKPTDVTYNWDVKVTEGGGSNDVTTEGGIDSARNQLILNVSKARPNSSYRITLRRTQDNDARTYTLDVEFGTDGTGGMVVATSPPREPGPAEKTPAEKTPAEKTPAEKTPAEQAPADYQPPSEIGGTPSQRLVAAKAWAERVRSLPLGGELVLPVTFFEEQLSKSPDGTRRGLKTVSLVPLLGAEQLYQAVYRTVENYPEGTDLIVLRAAWAVEKEGFANALDAEVGEVDAAIALWKQFLDEWERAVVRTAPERFRAGLLQMSLIVTATLLGHEEKSIEAVLKGVRPQGNTSQTRSQAGSSGWGAYPYHHYAPHGGRKWARMQMRYEQARRYSRY